MLIQSLYFFIFLSLKQKIMSQIVSAPVEARVFRFCIHLEDGQVYCVKENQGANIYFAFFLNFSFLTISHSYVMHMDIFRQRFLRNYLTWDY